MAGAPTRGRNGRRRLAAEMNVVPYIDVMLVLLVIFMVTAPLLTQGVNVELPKTAANPIPSSEEPVTLYVDAQGSYYLDIGKDQKQPLNDDQVVKRLGAVLATKPGTMVLIKADKRVPYDAVAHGMTLVQASGATHVGFVTQPAGSSTDNHDQHKRG
jgi:Cell division and transport-associated protein TolR (TC 2.C.1.2.1)